MKVIYLDADYCHYCSKAYGSSNSTRGACQVGSKCGTVHLIGSLILPLTVIATTRALRNVRVTYIVVVGQTVMT